MKRASMLVRKTATLSDGITLGKVTAFADVFADMPKETQEERNTWLRGYAAALAALIRLHDRGEIAKDIMLSDGLAVRDFEAAGVEGFDLKPIKEACK